jgi:hypothetical protein
MKINVDSYLNSEWEKYCEEQGCDLTEDDLTLLGEHTKQMEEAKARGALFDIALIKSYAYCEEFNPTSGRTEPKQGANYLKEGYIDGFLAGFAHKMGGGHGSD